VTVYRHLITYTNYITEGLAWSANRKTKAYQFTNILCFIRKPTTNELFRQVFINIKSQMARLNLRLKLLLDYHFLFLKTKFTRVLPHNHIYKVVNQFEKECQIISTMQSLCGTLYNMRNWTYHFVAQINYSKNIISNWTAAGLKMP